MSSVTRIAIAGSLAAWLPTSAAVVSSSRPVDAAEGSRHTSSVSGVALAAVDAAPIVADQVDLHASMLEGLNNHFQT